MREQLRQTQQELADTRSKAARDYEQLQKDLTERNKREQDALIKKYEQMLDDLRKNANSDKEFVQNELRKRIAELEALVE